MAMRMTVRSVRMRLFYINLGLFVFTAVLRTNGGSNTTAHSTTDNSTLTTSHFGADRRAQTTADCATKHCTAIHCIGGRGAG